MAVRIVKTRKVAVTRPPLLRKMAARADFDDVYVRYAFMALETPVPSGRQPSGHFSLPRDVTQQINLRDVRFGGTSA